MIHSTAIDLAAEDDVTAFDFITGTEDADTLDGTARGDEIDGLGGDDLLHGLHGRDLIVGGAGDDSLYGGRGDDTLVGGAGNDLFEGGQGEDFVDLTADGPVSGRLSGQMVTADGVDQLIDIEGLYLGDGDDHIEGGHHAVDYIYDSGGDNSFLMGKENDFIRLSGNGSNTVDGGLGNDFIRGANGDDSLVGGGQMDTVLGRGGDDFIQSAWHVDAGHGRDLIRAVDGLTTIDGGKGFDTLDFSDFQRTVSLDIVDGAAAGDIKLQNVERFIGSTFGDILAGNASLDGPYALVGRGGDDFLYGSAGSDTLIGGHGRDQMTGYDSSDLFIFASVKDSSHARPDEITDLAGEDVIDLHHIDADVTQAGDQAFQLVGGLSGKAGELTMQYDAVSNVTLLEGDVDGDGVADLLVRIDGDQNAFSNFVF